MTVQTAVLICTQPLKLRFVTFTTSTSTSFAKMSDFPEIKSKHSLVAKYVTEPLWEKLGKLETKTSQFTLSKAIACAVLIIELNCTGDGLAQGELGGLGLKLAQLLPQRLRHVLSNKRMLRLDLREVGHLGEGS